MWMNLDRRDCHYSLVLQKLTLMIRRHRQNQHETPLTRDTVRHLFFNNLHQKQNPKSTHLCISMRKFDFLLRAFSTYHIRIALYSSACFIFYFFLNHLLWLWSFSSTFSIIFSMDFIISFFSPPLNVTFRISLMNAASLLFSLHLDASENDCNL